MFGKSRIASVAAAAAMAGLIGGSTSLLTGCKGDKGHDSDKGMNHDCKGKNACHGQGGCKTGDQGCKGKNSCAGKGGCNPKM